MKKNANYKRLRGMAWLVMVSSGTGVLLFIPPFAIWPVYTYTLFLHAWLGWVLAFPFLLAGALHGIQRLRRRGWNKYSQSGCLFSLLFFLAVITAAFSYWLEEPPPWMWMAHMASGGAVCILALIHGLRSVEKGNPEKER